MRAAGFLVVALALIPVSVHAQAAPDLARYFGGLDGTFVLLNENSGQYHRHDSVRAARQFAPCSTFKVPNTAILLESGAAPDPGFTLKYDPALSQPSGWARDFDLTGAFRASALWYYQALSRVAGLDAERRLVAQFRYGNGDVSGGLDRTGNPFWVDGTLRISANEQVQFLRALWAGELGLSDRTTRLTRQIMLAEETAAWRLYAKTGACQPPGEDTSNWYVGVVERGTAIYYFALQIGAPDFGRAFSERVPITRAILTELGVLH
jgi:beta-lactamase class D